MLIREKQSFVPCDSQLKFFCFRDFDEQNLCLKEISDFTSLRITSIYLSIVLANIYTKKNGAGVLASLI